MKQIFLRTACILLCASLCLSLFGCDKPKGETTHGIQIDDDKPYSEELLEYSRDVIFKLVKHYVQKKTVPNLPEATIVKINGAAEDLAQIFAENPIGESKYRRFMSLIDDEGCAVIDELLSGEGFASLMLRDSLTKDLYLSLTQIAGADFVAELLYLGADFYYAYFYAEKIEDYESYGYTHLLKEAEELLESGRILKEEIGKDSFIAAVKHGISLLDLLLGNALSSESASAFNNTEALVFISHLKINEIDATAKGWEWLLTMAIGKYSPEDASFYDALLVALGDRGDVSRIAAVMPRAVELITYAQQGLTESDAELIKNGDYIDLLNSVFSKFTDAQWLVFEEITSVTLDTEYYDALAAEYFGAEYEEYAADAETASCEQLRESVGTNNFKESLKRFIAGISPALSYGINYD